MASAAESGSAVTGNVNSAEGDGAESTDPLEAGGDLIPGSASRHHPVFK